jgi:hypothetical protein
VIWLLLGASAVGLLAACLVVEELLFERRPPTPRRLAVVLTPPPLPRYSPWMHADLRHTRPPGPVGPGRHRTPGGPV